MLPTVQPTKGSSVALGVFTSSAMNFPTISAVKACILRHLGDSGVAIHTWVAEEESPDLRGWSLGSY